MKKIILLYSLLLFSCTLIAQVSKTVNVTAGGLSSALTTTEKNTITNLTITGTIDARDFRAIRGELSQLINIDLKEVKIAYYYGKEGTIVSSYGIDYHKDEIPIEAFKNKKIISIRMPESISSIGNIAFYGCSSLTSLTIPNSVTSIGESAFYACSGLTSITIPNSVTTIEKEAFYECSGLTSITIPNSVTSIEEEAFYGCSGLTSITIPNSVTSIGLYAFYACSGLATVTTPFFDGYSFKNSPNLTKVILSDGVQTIYGFAGFSNIHSITIPNSVTTIGERAFYECTGLTSITIPNSVTSIGVYAFNGCRGLTSIIIPNSTTSIGGGAFYGCTGIKSIDFPLVTSIGNSAFYRCTGLTSINLPSVTSIGDGAFYGCTGIKSIDFPLVTSIGNSAFDGCTGLTSINLPLVTSIGANAFNGCNSILSINFSNSLKSIGSSAFENCTNLQSLSLPNGITKIESKTFKNCQSLKDVYIPWQITLIGEEAFANCTSLTQIIFPNSISRIGKKAFSDCINIASIYANPVSPPYAETDAFYNINKLTCNLFVPKGSKSVYQNAGRWKDFFNIVEGDGFWLSSSAIFVNNLTGNTSKFNIVANSSWIASTDQSWITINKPTGTGYDSVSFTLADNPGASRTGIISVLVNGVVQTVTVVQDANMVSTNSINNSDFVNLFPNPATDYFSLKGIAGKALVQLYSIDGRLVMEKEVLENDNFIINSLKQGIYTVRINIGDSIFVKKLMKL